MGDADQSKTRIVEPVEIAQVAGQRVRALNPQKPGDDVRLGSATFEKPGQIIPGLENRELAVRSRLSIMETTGLVQRALCQVVPGRERPALGDRQQRDV